MIFRDATGSLTPHRRIGELLAEVAVATRGYRRWHARTEAARMLEPFGCRMPAGTCGIIRMNFPRHAPARGDAAR